MLYSHLPLKVRNYATLADLDLLDAFDLQIENYSIKDY